MLFKNFIHLYHRDRAEIVFILNVEKPGLVLLVD